MCFGCCSLNKSYSFRLLDEKTPYVVLCGKEPNFDALRVFGCLCFAHDQRDKGNKFAPRSWKCIFVCYLYGKKGWRLYDLDLGDFFVSRDVQFHENEFPFSPDPASSYVSADVIPLDLTVATFFHDREALPPLIPAIEPTFLDPDLPITDVEARFTDPEPTIPDTIVASDVVPNTSTPATSDVSTDGSMPLGRGFRDK